MKKDEIQQRVRETLPRLPARDRVKRISLFGSQLRGSAGPDSDVDLLIEFSAPVGYFDLARMQRHLAQSLGVCVDLVTPAALSKYFRDEVVQQAEPLYER